MSIQNLPESILAIWSFTIRIELEIFTGLSKLKSIPHSSWMETACKMDTLMD